MSHFSVMVVTDEQPTYESLTALLQPWHEFECTGTDDEYVQDIDETEETRKEFETLKVVRYRDSEGEYHLPSDERFFRDPTHEELVTIGPIAGTGWGNGMHWRSDDWNDGKGYRAKVQFVPDGYEEVELPAAEVGSFLDFAKSQSEVAYFGEKLNEKHKFGYAMVDLGQVVKIVRRTNPNKRWDWWTVGGRYEGRLEILGTKVDQARVGDMDRQAMKQANVDKRREWVVECMKRAELNEQEFEIAIVQNREAYAAWLLLPPDERPRGGVYYEWASVRWPLGARAGQANFELPEVPEGMLVGQWIESAPSLSAWAVVMDGKWYEKGTMGWWGMASNEQNEWDGEFGKLVASLRGDQWVTIVDCHI